MECHTLLNMMQQASSHTSSSSGRHGAVVAAVSADHMLAQLTR
jgi:hypothetical protein